MARILTALTLMVWFAWPGHAAPITYALDPERSTISFTYMFGADPITGSFPDFSADIAIDFDNPPASQVSATIATETARGGFPFASQALRSARMLDADAFPNIHFISTGVTGQGNTAILDGELTLRGVTRQVTLTAQLFRDPDSPVDERRDLSIVITGSFDRHAFGVSGWRDEVGATLDIEIRARILAR